MIVDENFNRRVRIVGKLGELRGYMMEVYDAETGESINNVYRVDITLNVNALNVVELSYYKVNKETGHLIEGVDGGPIPKTITVENPELDVTAKGRPL